MSVASPEGGRHWDEGIQEAQLSKKSGGQNHRPQRRGYHSSHSVQYPCPLAPKTLPKQSHPLESLLVFLGTQFLEVRLPCPENPYWPPHLRFGSSGRLLIASSPLKQGMA